MADQERDPRAYELMTVFIPDLTDEDSQAQIEKIEGLVSSNGGSITETLTTSPWGRRRLAYTIRFNGVDYRDGIYTVFHFDMAPSALVEMEREMKLDTNLMRYLLVHDDPKAGEKFPEQGEADEESAEAGEAAEAGQAAGTATATATSDTESAGSGAPASETSEPAAAASAPVEEAPAADTTTDTAPPAAEPDAAESAPAEEAPATETTTDTDAPAANEAGSDDDKE